MLGRAAVAADLSVAPIYKAAPARRADLDRFLCRASAGGGACGAARSFTATTTGVDQTPGFDLSGASWASPPGFNSRTATW